MQERVEVRAVLGRCPYCHVEVGMADAKQACAECAAWHHSSCWTEHGGCMLCGERIVAHVAKDEERCRVDGCEGSPQRVFGQGPLVGLCSGHAKGQGLFLAGLMTVLLVVFVIPGTLLAFSNAPEAGALLLSVAALLALGRLYWRRLVARLEA